MSLASEGLLSVPEDSQPWTLKAYHIVHRQEPVFTQQRHPDKMAAPNTANLVARYLDEANIHQSVAPMIDIAFFNKPPGDDADETHLNSYTLGRILDYKTLPSCQGLEMLGPFRTISRDGQQTGSRPLTKGFAPRAGRHRPGGVCHTDFQLDGRRHPRLLGLRCTF